MDAGTSSCMSWVKIPFAVFRDSGYGR
jgi:hypothetical protein